MLGFHVRGSSSKEKINLNEILICYMLHGTNLWMWADNGQCLEPKKINDAPASNLYYLSDREFFYMETQVVNEVLNSNSESRVQTHVQNLNHP